MFIKNQKTEKKPAEKAEPFHLVVRTLFSNKSFLYSVVVHIIWSVSVYMTVGFMGEIACELEETLTPQQKEIWDRYTSMSMKASNMSCCDNFVLGFRTAANLLVEALVDCSDDSTFPIEG